MFHVWLVSFTTPLIVNARLHLHAIVFFCAWYLFVFVSAFLVSCSRVLVFSVSCPVSYVPSQIHWRALPSIIQLVSNATKEPESSRACRAKVISSSDLPQLMQVPITSVTGIWKVAKNDRADNYRTRSCDNFRTSCPPIRENEQEQYRYI